MEQFFRSHILPGVMLQAAGFRTLDDGSSKFEADYAEKFLQENPKVQKHLKLCAHCKDQVQSAVDNKEYIQTRTVDDSIDTEIYEKHKGKFVKKMLAKKHSKTQD